MSYDDKVINRMKRIEGQLRGIVRMMEQKKNCSEVVSQMAAVRTAIDRAGAVVVSGHLEQCVRNQLKEGEDTQGAIEEAVGLLASEDGLDGREQYSHMKELE